MMEITIDKIKQRENPYQLFIDGIKSEQTKRKYVKELHTFLKLVPSQLYQDNLQKIPRNQELEVLAKFFVMLAKKDPELVSDVIAAYIKEDRKRVESGEISSQTIPNHIKPIKALLDSNRIPIHWKSLNKLLPRRQSVSQDRAYTRQEIHKMLEVATDITDKVIILLFSSGGFRLESWEYFTWKDVVFFKNKDGSYKGAGLLIYRGDPESYWTFITPEACKELELYREKWKSDIGVYPKPDDPLIKSERFPTIHRLNQKGVRKRVDKIVTSIGLRPPLPPGKRRHMVQLDHGFRKYFNTMMRRAKVNYLDKEDMMGHKVGLEKYYERYQEEDFERFPEYQKAIPFLIISDEERLRIENQQKQLELDQVEKKDLEIQNLKQSFDDFKNGIDGRTAEYAKIMQKLEGDITGKVTYSLFHMMFEIMTKDEDKKQKLWKKWQEARKSGEEFDIEELFGLPKSSVLTKSKKIAMLERILQQKPRSDRNSRIKPPRLNLDLLISDIQKTPD